MSSATLSVDIDDAFLKHPVAEGGRVRRFMERAFAERQERTFAPSWTSRAIYARRNENKLAFPDLDVAAFNAGDRLWLSASLEDDWGVAELYDGAALLVQHILERADALFAADLISELVPDFGLALVTEQRRKVDWLGVLERAIAQAVAFEARTVASLSALSEFMRSNGISAALRGDWSPLGSGDGSAEHEIAVETLLAELLASERVGRARRSGTPATEIGAEPIAALQVERRRRFQSKVELPRLMKMLSAIDEIIPLRRPPAEEARLIDTVAAGEAPPEGE